MATQFSTSVDLICPKLLNKLNLLDIGLMVVHDTPNLKTSESVVVTVSVVVFREHVP